MSKRFIFTVVLFIIIGLAFIIIKTTYTQNSNLHNFASEATPTPISESTISLSPNPITTMSGKPAEADIVLEITGKAPTLVQFEISYNPNVITNVEIVPGDLFVNPTVVLNMVNPRIGRISYAIQPSKDQNLDNRSGKVALIKFIPLSGIQHTTTLSFLPKTVIREQGEKNTLKVGYGTSVIINPLTTYPQSTTSGTITY